MIKNIDINSVRDYILERERKHKNPTVFKIGYIPARILLQICDEHYGSAEIKRGEVKDPGKLVYKAVKFGLKGIENYSLEFKIVNEVHCGKSIDVVSDEFINSLPVSVLREVGWEIMNSNFLVCE